MNYAEEQKYELISGQSQGDDERFDLNEEAKSFQVHDTSDLDSSLQSGSTKSKSAIKSSDPFIERSKKWKMVKFKEEGEVQTPAKKNHSTTLYKNCLYVFGGYDGKKNHNQITVFNI